MSLTAEHYVFSEADRVFMNLALEQGRRALPGCKPNPPLGCVIVRHGVVVAGGFKQMPGHHHAQAMTLSKLAPALDGLTACVTLESCSFAWRPYCAQALVRAGITRVHVAMRDPDPRNYEASRDRRYVEFV